jgi:hypothetical protein
VPVVLGLNISPACDVNTADMEKRMNAISFDGVNSMRKICSLKYWLEITCLRHLYLNRRGDCT